jgi:hypothetical protein
MGTTIPNNPAVNAASGVQPLDSNKAASERNAAVAVFNNLLAEGAKKEPNLAAMQNCLSKEAQGTLARLAGSDGLGNLLKQFAPMAKAMNLTLGNRTGGEGNLSTYALTGAGGFKDTVTFQKQADGGLLLHSFGLLGK